VHGLGGIGVVFDLQLALRTMSPDTHAA
jgi:hypothetical protein